MRDTTTHCDFCGNPLGSKCDRDIASAIRAKLRGVIVSDIRAVEVILNQEGDYRFFCSGKCRDKFYESEIRNY